MPELPEVETAVRTMRDVLVGKTIARAEFPEDEIVLKGVSSEKFLATTVGRKVEAIGRKGKYWWIQFEGFPWLYGHLGMAGWIREYGAPTIRLREHGKAPLEDESGRPRFLKMDLETEEGRRIVFTDGRRLAKMWLGDDQDNKIATLSQDVWDEPYDPQLLLEKLVRRKAPMKSLLLNQELFAGVGNWIADEVLIQAKISPKRLGSEMTLKDAKALVDKLHDILEIAIKVGADSERYPQDWLFHTRWGGNKGEELFRGKPLVREPVGGRTTAWVPEIQK